MACPPSQPRTRQPWPPSGPLQAYGRVAKAGSSSAALLSMLHMCKGCRPLFPPPRGGRGSRGYAKKSPLPNAAQHGLEPWHAGSAAAVDMSREPHAEWLPLVTPLATSKWLPHMAGPSTPTRGPQPPYPSCSWPTPMQPSMGSSLSMVDWRMQKTCKESLLLSGCLL